MAEYAVKVSEVLLSNLLSGGKEGLGELVERGLNQVLAAQAEEQLGAGRDERSEARTGYRNGARARQRYRRVGPLTLRGPQFRAGACSTEIFQRSQRSEQALVLALMEMGVNGGSTRKVARIPEELGGTAFSQSPVARLCAALDARVRACNERALGVFACRLIDALSLKVRADERIVSTAALLVAGLSAEGSREVLGLRMGDSASEGFWRATVGWLKNRGLAGVAFVVSDAPKGLGGRATLFPGDGLAALPGAFCAQCAGAHAVATHGGDARGAQADCSGGDGCGSAGEGPCPDG